MQRQGSEASGRRARGLVALLLVISGPGSLGAQTAWPSELEQRQHVQAVRLERAARFYAAWDEASPAARAVAVAALEPGAPSGKLPPFDRLARATHALRGVDPELAASSLQGFVDAVDMQLRPGFFAAAAAGRGETIVVRLYLLYSVVYRPDVEVTLLWLGPRGEEIRARREPFSASTFHRLGFNMFLRAPLSEPGLWHLVAEVEAEGRTVRGAPVPVWCRAESPPPAVATASGAMAELAQLIDRGARPVGGARELFDRVEGVGAPAARRLGHAAIDVGMHVLVRPLASSARSSTVLVFPTRAGESSAALFAGASAAAWSELADRQGLDLVTVEAGSARKASFGELLRTLRAARPEREIIVVARGDAVATLHFLVAGVELPLDGLVLVGAKLAPGRALPDVPMLLVTAGEPVAVRPDAQFAADVVRGAPSAFVGERELPAIVEPWLERLSGR